MLHERDPWPPPLSPFLYELWQDDVIIAVLSGDNLESVWSAVLDRADQAAANGPVDVYRVLRVKVLPPLEIRDDD